MNKGNQAFLEAEARRAAALLLTRGRWKEGELLDSQGDPDADAWALLEVAAEVSFPEDTATQDDEPWAWLENAKPVFRQAGRVLAVLENGDDAFSGENDDVSDACAWRVFEAVNQAVVAFDR